MSWSKKYRPIAVNVFILFTPKASRIPRINMIVLKAIYVLQTNNPQKEFRMEAAEWFWFSEIVCRYEN